MSLLTWLSRWLMTKGTPRFTASTSVRPSETIACGMVASFAANVSVAAAMPAVGAVYSTTAVVLALYSQRSNRIGSTPAAFLAAVMRRPVGRWLVVLLSVLVAVSVILQHLLGT